MKIGIDARMMGNGFGIGRYIKQLVLNLEQLDRNNEYVVFLTKKNWNEYEPTHENFRKVEANVHWYTVKEQIVMPWIIAKEKVDLMHFPHFNVPVFYRKPFVVTIHDLIMFHYPRKEATTRGAVVFWIKDLAHRFVIRRAVKKAQRIIVTSEFTKLDLYKTLHVPQDKMEVVYQAPFVEDEWVDTDKNILDKYGIHKEYILYVGSAYPHKNLETLLKAWHIVEERHDRKYQLVLVGLTDYFYKRLLDSEHFKQCSTVVHTGFVSDYELASLYSWSNLYVFPSLYEGFGLPPLEAMRFNVPVVSSSETCLPEVLGDAAMYFDPHDPEHMCEVISSVLEDTDTQHVLMQNGRLRIKELSSKEFARKTLEVYRMIINN